MTRSSQFKLLAIDVDGTLLFDREEVSKANREALEAAKQHCMVSLCTGRSPREAGWIIDDLGLHDNFHILGGGAIVRKPDGANHHLATIKPEIVKTIVKHMPHYQFSYLTEGRWDTGIQKENSLYNSIATLVNSREHSLKLVAELQKIALDHHVTSIMDRDNYWVQITPPDCHKGSGVEYLVAELEISKDEVLVIGDMFNDLPMFAAVPYSVAMGNAPEEVKQKASFVTKEVHQDGLAHAIWEFLFNKI